MGIDEAGRGPVLGPMVYCGMIWNEDFDSKSEFNSIIVDDSKKVDKNNREKTK